MKPFARARHSVPRLPEYRSPRGSAALKDQRLLTNHAQLHRPGRKQSCELNRGAIILMSLKISKNRAARSCGHCCAAPDEIDAGCFGQTVPRRQRPVSEADQSWRTPAPVSRAVEACLGGGAQPLAPSEITWPVASGDVTWDAAFPANRMRRQGPSSRIRKQNACFSAASLCRRCTAAVMPVRCGNREHRTGASASKRQGPCRRRSAHRAHCGC